MVDMRLSVFRHRRKTAKPLRFPSIKQDPNTRRTTARSNLRPLCVASQTDA
jgi:hypothetical protein